MQLERSSSGKSELERALGDRAASFVKVSAALGALNVAVEASVPTDGRGDAPADCQTQRAAAAEQPPSDSSAKRAPTLRYLDSERPSARWQRVAEGDVGCG